MGAQRHSLHSLNSGRKIFSNHNIIGIVATDLSKAFDCLPHDLILKKT